MKFWQNSSLKLPTSLKFSYNSKIKKNFSFFIMYTVEDLANYMYKYHKLHLSFHIILMMH